MSEPAWLALTRVLADTGVFILWHRGDRRARRFFRSPMLSIYYSRVTRKEFLRPPIGDGERMRIVRLLATVRIINPDPEIAIAYSALLAMYPYLQIISRTR